MVAKRSKKVIQAAYYKKRITLKNGKTVLLRSMSPGDEQKEIDMFQHISPETQRFRYFTRIGNAASHLRARYEHMKYDQDIGILAEEKTNSHSRIIGGVYLFVGQNDKAEFAIIVADPWQGMGLGSALMDYMLSIAKKRKVRDIFAYVLPDNDIMIGMMKRRNFSMEKIEDTYIARLRLLH